MTFGLTFLYIQLGIEWWERGWIKSLGKWREAGSVNFGGIHENDYTF
jgi:hypothetical protein